MVRDGVPGLKIVTEQHHTRCDPDTVAREVTETEIHEFYHRYVSEKLAGVNPTCVAAEACLYTVTADEHFVIDWHPESARVLLASACSGHGFKHSAAIGEALVQMAIDGESALSMAAFAFSRLSANQR